MIDQMRATETSRTERCKIELKDVLEAGGAGHRTFCCRHPRLKIGSVASGVAHRNWVAGTSSGQHRQQDPTQPLRTLTAVAFADYMQQRVSCQFARLESLRAGRSGRETGG